MFVGGCSDLGLVENPKRRKDKGVIELRKESHGCILIKERELKGDIEWAAGAVRTVRLLLVVHM